nr:immunoglobulin light chain junction region [Macaca mulatta]
GAAWDDSLSGYIF